MCSSAADRMAHLARIGEAIDEVAAAARSAAHTDADIDHLAGLMAGVWAMVAEVDPGLARRLPRYWPDTD